MTEPSTPTQPEEDRRGPYTGNMLSGCTVFSEAASPVEVRDEFASCPFCGSDHLGVEGPECGAARWVTCDDCGCEGPIRQGEAEASAAWSTRPEPDFKALAVKLAGALGMANALIEIIDQTPGNVWYVAADDPETAVCDTYNAVDEALTEARKEGLIP